MGIRSTPAGAVSVAGSTVLAPQHRGLMDAGSVGIVRSAGVGEGQHADLKSGAGWR